MRRRVFIAALGAAAMLPMARVSAQDRPRRVGILMTLPADDREAQARVAAFQQGMQRAGWTQGRNLHVDIEWGTNNPERSRAGAAALIERAPDVILATGSTTVEQLLRATSTVPIVFVIVIDPVGAGYVASLARPGGDATGFLQFEFALCSKWVELLNQVAPTLKRVAVLHDPEISAGISAQLDVIASVAPGFGLDVVPISVRDLDAADRKLAGFAGTGNTGIIVTSSPQSAIHRERIVALAARHRLPAIYYERYLAEKGGLVSYGPEFLDQYRRAVDYVDRILKGASPATLPVQAPSRYELVVNLKTAKALGLEIAPTLLARADEVIE